MEKENMNEGIPVIIPEITEKDMQNMDMLIPPEYKHSRKFPEMKNAIMIEAITFDGKDPDTTKYLLLLHVFPVNKDDDYTDEECRSWVIKIGRQHTYDYLKTLIEIEAIDPFKSYIISETATIENSKRVDAFMSFMKRDERIIDNTDFNVSDYRYDTFGEEYPPSVIMMEDNDIEYKGED